MVSVQYDSFQVRLKGDEFGLEYPCDEYTINCEGGALVINQFIKGSYYPHKVYGPTTWAEVRYNVSQET